MEQYTIYSKPGCTFCDKAKSLFKSREIQFTEKIIDVGQQKQQGITYVSVNQLRELVPNAKTVPQIFHGDKHIGGYDALTLYISK